MKELTAEDVADIIERFLDGTSRDRWEWDDFISVPLTDPVLEAVRQRCGQVRDDFPPPTGIGYCGPEGEELLRKLAEGLRNGNAGSGRWTGGER